MRLKPPPLFVLIPIALLFLVLSAVVWASDKPVVSQLETEATALQPLVSSTVAADYLRSVGELPEPVDSTTIYIHDSTRGIISADEYDSLADSVQAAYKLRKLAPSFYYYTRYGSPLAFVRPLDLVANAGLKNLDGARIIDFGFGSIGQIRLMASLGADAVGIDVDPLLDIIYSTSGDTGIVPRAPVAGEGEPGRAEMRIGHFPADLELLGSLGDGYDVFFSKNTLKRGYIHPAREVNPRMLVHLGVNDSTFVQTVYDLLKPGGFFMIYNLHPAEAPPDEPYIPWADGRCPFDRGLLERIGFTILEYDTDDTEFAHRMGAALGWDEQMNLDTDLFGTCTILRK